MSAYRETDGHLIREYDLAIPAIQTYTSEKALLEMVPTKEFGSAFFLDNVLQLAEKDEYIYHEMLVHPCMASSDKKERVCILGGGDGCAAREVLKWKEVTHVDIFDWDKCVIDIFENKYAWMNGWAFHDPRVHSHSCDVRSLIDKDYFYDCIIVDLLDPDESKLDLWRTILDCARKWIRPGGSIVINAGGILPWQTDSFNWILQQIESRPSLKRHLYKVFVPSFAREWCFVLLNQANSIELPSLPDSLHYLDATAWHQAYIHGWTKNYHKTVQGLF